METNHSELMGHSEFTIAVGTRPTIAHVCLSFSVAIRALEMAGALVGQILHVQTLLRPGFGGAFWSSRRKSGTTLEEVPSPSTSCTFAIIEAD